MDNYHIASTGNGFQVIENRPDGRHSTVSGFPTESDARLWLDGFLVLLGLVDCMAGKPNRRQKGDTQNA
jgi:hypothetical protein